MPTLNWIGKEAVVKHHKDVPYRLLEPVEELSFGDIDSGNLIVQGDNLHALKALLPRYGGKVKCIYIDPPYNTGNEKWVYNDNVNSPEIRKWLGEVVGKEDETLDRHDRWLCMMYPRLFLLSKLLREDGVIFISIGEDECGTLELICREIFGLKNQIAKLVWNTEGNTDNQFQIKINHEYILAYVKNDKYKNSAIGHVIDPNTRKDSNLWKGVADNNINKNNKANPPATFIIPIGFPCSEETLFYPAKKIDKEFFDITSSEAVVSKEIKEKYSIEAQSGLPIKLDDLIVENYKVVKECKVYGGFANRNKLDSFVKNNCQAIDDNGDLLKFYINRNAGIRYNKEKLKTRNILSVLRNFGTTETMRTRLKKMGIEFDYPKPVELIKYLLSFGAENKDSIILDSFSGSGTTSEAVLRLNQEDNGSRKFILVEMDENTASTITSERTKKVVSNINTINSETKDQSFGFQYCRLSKEPLFTALGQIRADVNFSQLAEFVWFAETGTGYLGDSKSPLLGIHEGRAIYLLYNGILKDKSVQGGNVVTQPVYKMLPEYRGAKVIYAAAMRGSNWANREQISFKQTPYALEV